MSQQFGEDHGGLAAALEACRGELLRFLAARCGAADEAQDLLQELWIKVTTQPAAPVASPRAYLFRMANNLVLDQRRARQRAMTRDRRWLEEDDGPGGPPEDRPDPAEPADEALARRQEADLLRRAIDGLPPGARRALCLYRFEGRGQGEIAEIMGISRSGVEKHLALAMKHLRNMLSDCGYFAAAASHKREPTGDAESHAGKIS